MCKQGIKAALIDLSGTIHISERPITGAVQACTKLQSLGIPVRYLTNTSKTSSSALLAQLRRIGFNENAVPEGSIMTSTCAARELLVRNHMRPLCLVEEELMDDLKGRLDTADPNCVLVGLAPSAFNYERLNEAFRLLLRIKEEEEGKEGESSGHSTAQNDAKPSPLVAIHRAKYYRESDGELSLGPGGFVRCLEESVGVEALVVGKPSRSFFEAAVADMNVKADEVVMVGDDVVQDVGGALSAGLGNGILVRTGKFRPGDEDSAPEGAVVVDSIVEAVDYICSNVKRVHSTEPVWQQK